MKEVLSTSTLVSCDSSSEIEEEEGES